MTAPTINLDDRPDLGPELLPGVSRVTAIDLVERLRDMFQAAETRIAADIARRLRAGMDSPTWAQDKLNQLAELRRSIQAILARLDQDATHEVTYAIVAAYLRGGEEANRALVMLGLDLPAHPDARLREVLNGPRSGLTRRLAELTRFIPGLGAIMRVAGSLTLRIRGTYLPVLRWSEDVYRKVIAETALPDVLLGVATRRRAAQVAWERLLGEGVKGFTDKAGRRWELASYVEMAVRAGTAQAAVEGHLDRLDAAGIGLVIISNAPQECIKCRPWEGKVLTRNGVTGPRTVKVESAISDQLVEVKVKGTVPEAVAAGLLHPNCRHSISAFLPGVTRIPTNTEDPEGDAARQRLRFLERKVRKEKLLAAAAIERTAKTAHERRARGWQAKIREHVAATEHLGIFRKPERERIGTAR